MSQEQILKKKNYQNVFHNQESLYKIIEIIESKENVWLCATEQHVVVRDTAGEVGTVELGMDCCAEHKICFDDQFGGYISNPDWTQYIILDQIIFTLIQELTPNHIVSHFPPARVLILLNNSEGTTLIDICQM